MAENKPSPDPVPQFTGIEIRGITYKMCLEYDSLLEAEAALLPFYSEANLLAVLSSFTANTTRVFFAMALQRWHPDISYPDRLALVGWGSCFKVANAIAPLWASLQSQNCSTPSRALVN